MYVTVNILLKMLLLTDETYQKNDFAIITSNTNIPNQRENNPPLLEIGLNAEHWYKYCATQQPLELKLTLPPTDRGGRGYSDEYVARATEELLKC